MTPAADLSASPSLKKLGLIAGRGELPKLMAEAAREQGWELFVLGFAGDTQPELADQTLPLAEIADTLDIMREQQVTHILMAGGLSRPPLKALKASPLTKKLLARIGKAFFGGDDALFKAITKIFEEEGFTILGADELLADLVTPAGTLTQKHPSREALEDIAVGSALLREIGKRDTGQAIILCHGKLLGAETAEGTDALISRCARIAPEGEYRGALMKGKKPGQEARVDLPSAGVQTIRNLHAAGFAGLALEAGGSLMIGKTEMIALADELGMFIQGFHADQTS